MKTYALFTTLFLLAFYHSSGKIINGYEKDIHTARASLKHLAGLPQDQNVKTRLERVKEYILFYELTERLLQQFQTIVPALHKQIDTIQDFSGRSVDVYVKFVPKTEIQAGTLATTNIDQMKNDPHGYYSNYGPHSVSVKIVTTKHSLLILAHEFGHVRYQVPNLSSYVNFFLRHYQDQHMKANYLGHKPNDPSGQSAVAFEKIYREENTKFVEITNDKPVNPILILDQITKVIE